MANWAKLQEDLVGLPVAKRAKHGIHFKKGADEFVANFSGKPCHYLDGGLWKPIDTKLLLLPDGYYGCPHSPVKVHTDGHVKVDGTDYTQYTKLPTATGYVDGDRIVRTFSFGEQRMWVTESGYRSEIQLNRIPTLQEARKLITSESGTLSKEYLKSLTTATDANGDVHTYSTLTAFRTWLASAVYPVTIDPDFGCGNGGDTWVVSPDPTINYGTAASNHTYQVKLLHRFILSSIESSSICTAAALKLTATATKDVSVTFYKITDANGDWIEGTKTSKIAGSGEPCWNAKEADGSGGVTTAWAGSAGLSTAGTDYINTALGTMTCYDVDAAGTQYTATFNASGIAVVQDWFGDATNNGFLGIPSASQISHSFAASEHATESYRPVLTVTYTTAGGTLLRVNMNGNMQSLTGGFHG